MMKVRKSILAILTIFSLIAVGLYSFYPELRSLVYFRSETFKSNRKIAAAKAKFIASGTLEPPRIVHETQIEISKLPEDLKIFLTIMGANSELYDAEFENQEKGLHWMQMKFPLGRCPKISRGGHAGKMVMSEYQDSEHVTWFDFRSATQWLMGSREQGAFGCRIEFFLRPGVPPKSDLRKTS